MIKGSNLKLNRVLNIRTILVLAFLLSFVFVKAFASVPSIISYKSRLRTASGTPVTTPTTIQFSLYNSISSGSSTDTPNQNGALLWTETYDGSNGSCPQITPDSNGYLNVNLGSCVSFPSYLDFSNNVYLGVKVGTDAEASPRVAFTAAPYALNSERVNGLRASSTPTPNEILSLDSNLNFNIATGTFIGNNLRLSSLAGSSTQCLATDINGNVVGTGNPCGAISNIISSAGNILTTTVDGHTATTTIINSNTIATSTNTFQNVINGIVSNVVNIINTFTQSVTGNTLTTTINGVTATTSIISNNSINYAGGVLTTNVNGVISTTSITGLLPATTNSISSSLNTLLSSVNGVDSTTTLINSNTISASNGIVTTNINGVIATTSISNLYTFSASSTNNNLTVSTTTNGQVVFSLSNNPVFINATSTNFFSNILNTITGYFTNLFANTLTATTANITNLNTTNNLSLSNNVLTSNVGGSIGTSTIIATNTINYAGGTLTTNVNGVISTTSITGLLPATTNSLSSNTNTLTSNVNGVISTSSIINTNIASTTGNYFETIVNGISSGVKQFINSFSQSSSGNILTTVINGITGTSTIINSNTIATTTNTFQNIINGVSSAVTNIINSNTLSVSTSTNSATITSNINGVTASTTFNTINSVQLATTTNSLQIIVNGVASSLSNIINSFTQSLSGNTLTTTINGVSTSTPVISSNSISYSSSTNILTSNVNGVTATTSISILGSYLPLSGGTLTGALTGTSASFNSSVTASSFIKSNGTSTQFLKADGSVDSNSYLTTSSAGSTYLPLSGGTLTGALSGTNISISGKYTAANGTLDTPNTLGLFGYGGGETNRSVVIQNILNNSTAKQYLFLNGSLGSSSTISTITTTSAYAGTFGFESTDNSLSILTASNGTNQTPIRALTFNSSGAATFNNSVTAGSFIKSGGTSAQFLKADGSVDGNNYLPLTGGTLTGSLAGTSASFSTTANNFSLESTGTSSGEISRVQFYQNSGSSDTRSGVIEWYKGGSFSGDLRLLASGGIDVHNPSDQSIFNINASGVANFKTSLAAPYIVAGNSFYGNLDWSYITSKPTIPNNTNQLTNGSGFITGSYTGFDSRYQPLEDQRLSTSNTPTFAGLTLTSPLSFPSGSTLGKIWNDGNMHIVGDPVTWLNQDILNITNKAQSATYATFGNSGAIFYNNTTLNSIPAGSSGNNILVSNGGVISYRTPTQILSDIGGVSNTSNTIISSQTFAASTTIKFGNAGYVGLSSSIFTGGSANDLGLNSLTGNILFGNGSIPTNPTMILNSSGYLGLGTLSPSYKLDVSSGDINTSGAYRVNGVQAVGQSGSTLTLGTTGANSLSLYAGAADRLYINYSTGNIGIGTTNTAEKLDVNGNIIFENVTSGRRDIRGTVGDNDFWSVGGNPTGNNAGVLEFATGDDATEPIVARQYIGSPWGGTKQREVYILDGSGNSSFPGSVGVGTASPGAKLQIYGGDGTYNAPNFGSSNLGAINISFSGTSDRRTGITFSSSGGNSAQAGIYVHQDDSNGTHMYLATTDNYATGPQARLTILNNGNVGIGTTNPGFKLEVQGDTYANGNIRIGGTNALYFNDYGGGWFMQDSTWIRSANTASVWLGSGWYGTNGGLTIGYGGAAGSEASGGAIIAGNVGIGTTNPAAKFQVNGDAYFGNDTNYKDASIRLGGVNSRRNFYSWWDNTSNTGGYTGMGQDSYVSGWSTNIFAIGDGTNSSPAIDFVTGYTSGSSYASRMRITNSGNVGIGNTTPNVRLQITENATNGAPILGSSSTGGFAFLSPSNNYGLFMGVSGTGDTWLQGQRSDGGTTPYNILLNPSGGNVGIGTTNPQATLDVNGSGNFSGALTGTSATFSGSVTASSFVKSGGTSSQFLKADGSVDSNTYVTSSSLGSYLPLGGGTLTGPLYIDSTALSISTGTGDGANFSTANMEVKSWWGIGFKTTCCGLNTSYGIVFDTRTGSIFNQGNIGIGTANTLSKLDVLASGSQLANADVVGTAANFESLTPTGQSSTVSIVGNNSVAANIGGVLGFGGNYNGTQYANWASIKGLKYDGTSGNYGGYLSFWTRQTGSASAERMRIDTNGNVGINNTSPQYKLDVNGAGNFTGALNGTSANFSGNVTVNNTLSVGGAASFGGIVTAPVYVANNDYSFSGRSGMINMGWTQDNNWGESGNNWRGWIGFNAFRQDGWTTNQYQSSNQYTNMGALEFRSGYGLYFKTAAANGSNNNARILNDVFRVDESGNTTLGNNLTIGSNSANNNIYTGTKTLITDNNDGYLRLNQNNNFSNGVYTPGAFRADGTGIFNSGLTVGSMTSDSNFPFYVTGSTATNRYSLTNPGMGFNLSDGFAQLQLYGNSGAYIDFANSSGQDFGGRILWNGGNFQISGPAAFNNNLSVAGNLTVAGNGVITSGNIGSQSVNYATSANVASYLNSAQSSADACDITTRVNSGFYQCSSTNTSNGWPVNGSWWHMLSTTHSNGSNYYAMQLAADFYSNNLYYRSTNGSGSTAWTQVITANNIGGYAVLPGAAISSFENDMGYFVNGSSDLEVNGDNGTGIVARMMGDGAGCTLYWGTGYWSCTSDINLKKNITDLSNGDTFNLRTSLNASTTLDKLLTITPVMFNWKAQADGTQKSVGFIAQEVEQLLPNIVTTDKNNGTKSISYEGFAPYIVESIQELYKKTFDINSTSSALLFANVGSSTLINNTLQNSFNNLANFLASTTDINIASTTLANLNDLFSTSSLASIKALTNSLTLNNFDLNLNGNALVNVKAIESASKNWKIGEDGIIYAKEVRADKYCNSDGSKCIDVSNLSEAVSNTNSSSNTQSAPVDSSTSTASSTIANNSSTSASSTPVVDTTPSSTINTSSTNPSGGVDTTPSPSTASAPADTSASSPATS